MAEKNRIRSGERSRGRSSQNSAGGDKKRLLRAGFIGAGGGLLLSLLLLLLCTAIASGREDPAPILPILGKLPWIFGAAFAGLLASLLLRERNFLCPLLAGGSYLFCVLLLSLGLGDNSIPRGALYFIVSALVILVLAVLGGLVTMPGRQKKNASVRRRAKQMRRSYR